MKKRKTAKKTSAGRTKSKARTKDLPPKKSPKGGVGTRMGLGRTIGMISATFR